MSVTGLVVGAQGVNIGAERKAKVIAQVEASLAGHMDPKQLVSLKGLLAFVHGVEPAFLEALGDRYGHDAIRAIHAYLPPSP
jgi:hypothetical protein